VRPQPRPWSLPFGVRIVATLCLYACLPAVAETTAGQTKDSAHQPTMAQLPGQISGYVYRADTGEPVPKAEVSLDPQDQDTGKAAGGSRVVRTGPDGAFAFSDLPAGSYALNVWRNGFASFSCQRNGGCRGFSLKRGQKLQNIDLRMTPAAVITGEISDEDHEPVAGIEVYALRADYLPGGGLELSGPYRVLTDDRGIFRISDMLPGTYYIRAGGLIERPMKQTGLKEGIDGGLRYRDAYYPGTALFAEAEPVEAKPGSETNNIRIPVATEKIYSITGAVVGKGKAAELKHSEASVSFTKRSDAEQMFGDNSNTGTTMLGPDRSFTIRRLSPGEYTLTAVTDDLDEGRAIDEGYAFVRIVDSDTRVNIEIGRSAELRGNVKAPQGFSSAGEQIILETTGMRIYPSDIDSSGRFDIVNIPPGQYTISLQDPKSKPLSAYVKQALCSGRDYASQPQELELGTLLDCDVTLVDDTGVVGGEVNDGDKPAAGLVVVLIPESRALRRLPRYTLTTNTDAAGRYHIAGAIPGDYFLFAVTPSDDHAYFALDFADRNQRSAERLTVAPRATQVVNLKASRAQ
jgi:hypothetical protein